MFGDKECWASSMAMGISGHGDGHGTAWQAGRHRRRVCVWCVPGPEFSGEEMYASMGQARRASRDAGRSGPGRTHGGGLISSKEPSFDALGVAQMAGRRRRKRRRDIKPCVQRLGFFPCVWLSL